MRQRHYGFVVKGAWSRSEMFTVILLRPARHYRRLGRWMPLAAGAEAP